MPINVAINGYGRIGRNILRALYESGRTDEIRVVAVNDLGDAETNAHLTRYDTAHVVFEPRNMSAEELARGYGWVYQRLFSHTSIWRRRSSAIASAPVLICVSCLPPRANIECVDVKQ